MKNFDFKKYFGNLIRKPTSMKQPVTKPKLEKGVSDTRLVKRSK
jgi:hypothetical protein